MADTAVQITLNTTGGDAAASQIKMASDAIQNVTKSSSDMEGQFQHRFQHIGLMLFAGDALRASGLGNETRQVINTLNMALTAGAEAAGVSSGGILLVVVALTALIGIIDKVIDHHKSLVDQLTKASEANEKQIKSTDEIIASLTKYKDAVGSLTPALHNLLVAEENLRQQQIKSQETTNQGLLVSLNQKIALEKDSIAALEQEAAAASKAAAALQSLKPGMEGYSMLLRYQTAVDDLNKKLNTQQMSLARDTAQVNQIIAQQINLLHGVTAGIDKQAEAAQKDADKQAKAYKKMWELRIADARAHTKAVEKEMEKVAKSTGDTAMYIGKTFGSAFAQVVVEGGDMADAMQKAAIKMAEQFIESTIEMIIYWTALRAVMTLLPGGAAAFQTAAQSAYPGVSQMMFSQAGTAFAGSAAIGGSFFADRPTMALFGEAGPEVATFSPMSGGGSMGGGGSGESTQVNNITVNVNGGMVDEKTLSKIGQYIVQTIRGQGQIAFT